MSGVHPKNITCCPTRNSHLSAAITRDFCTLALSKIHQLEFTKNFQITGERVFVVEKQKKIVNTFFNLEKKF